MKAPSPPPAPDPYKTSAADQQGHTGTAIAQTWMNNANESTPFGTVNYDRTGTQYTKDATGKEIEIPTFSKTTALSKDEQAKYDLENQLAQRSGTIANKQLERLDGTLSTPLSFDNAPQIKGNYDFYRDEAERALRDRMRPQLDQDYQQTLTRLANQGVRPESEAYREAVALGDRARNDADLAIIGQAGGEAERAFGLDQSARQTAVQEILQLRNQPINEISALMGQSQVNVPQFQQYKSGTIQPTSVGDNIWKKHDADMKAYQIQAQNKQAMMGGLFSLGGSLLRLPFMGFGR